MIVGVQQECGPGFTLVMILTDPIEIHIHHSVPIKDYERIGQQWQLIENGTCCTERFALDNRSNLNPPAAAVPEMALDQIRPVTGEKYNVIETKSTDQFHLM